MLGDTSMREAHITEAVPARRASMVVFRGGIEPRAAPAPFQRQQAGASSDRWQRDYRRDPLRRVRPLIRIRVGWEMARPGLAGIQQRRRAVQVQARRTTKRCRRAMRRAGTREHFLQLAP